MECYLITHSLLSSWLYALKDNPYEDQTTEKDAFDEFVKVLNREETETTDAMRKGVEFENLVSDVVDGIADDSHPWYGAACKVAERVKGGRLQHKAYKEIKVAGMRVLLYGRLDALKAGVVYDIKFTSNYDVGKFYGSTQHPTYLEIVPEAHKFVYLVSNGNSVWTETYRRDETADIKPIISDFFDWLSAVGLMDTYREKWKSNKTEG